MEIKSWRELSKTKKRARKKKFIPSGQTADSSLDIEEAITQFYTESVKAETISEENIVTTMPAKNKYTSTKLSSSRQQRKGKENHHWFFWLVVGGLLLASAVLLFSALRFAGSPTGRNDMELVVIGPETVAIGQEATWVINYKNTGRVDLKKINISVRYPEGLKLKLTEPTADNLLNTNWEITDLSKGQSGEIKITAQIYGSESEIKDFLVEAVYQPANFSSDFVQSITYSVRLSNSQLAIDWGLPESILPEVEQEMSVRVKNTSGQELSDLIVKLITSRNFAMTNPQPEISGIEDTAVGKAYTWPMRDFLNNQEINFNFKGKFSSTARGLENIKLEISQGKEKNKILQETEYDVVILGEEMVLQMQINGQNEISEISPGQQLTYAIVMQNTAGVDLYDLQLELQLSQEMVDWSSLQTVAEPQITDEGLVILTGAVYEPLQQLARGEELKINLTINIKEVIPDFSERYRSFVRVSVGRVGEEKKDDLSFSTNVVSAQVIAPLKVLNYAYFRDDEGVPEGSGPWPPQVGEKTVLPIELTLQARQSFDQITLTAFLPNDVNWENNQLVNKGVLSFNEVSRLLSWQVGPVDKSDGVVEARFDVSIVPTIADLGKVKILLNSQTIKTQSEGKSSQFVWPALDTNLTGAMYDVGQGVVVE